MEGTYIIGDLEVTDPTVQIYEIGRSLLSSITTFEYYIFDDNDGGTLIESDEGQPTSWTIEDIQIFIENYLQKYKQ